MVRVYQSADGQWIVFSEGVKKFFTTQEEAVSMADKVKFSQQAQAFSTTLAQLFMEAPDLESVYFDAGFNTGGTDEIKNNDIVSLGITAAELADFITVAQQLQKFDIGDVGDPVVNANYGILINAMRIDL